jgi:hypothetical protein
MAGTACCPLRSVKRVAVNDRAFKVRLAPAAGAKLTVTMAQFANEPTLSFPELVG